LTFEPCSKVSILGPSAFLSCSSLQSICIPSSVQTISDSCFAFCPTLSNVAFEPDSQISILEGNAFDFCSSLRSIWIPSSVQTISRSCFDNCAKLLTVVLESGSKLSAESLSALRSRCAVTLR
jgi:hypothetical protein